MEFICKRKLFNLWRSKYEIYDEDGKDIVFVAVPRKKFFLVYDIIDKEGNIVYTIKMRYGHIMARCDLYDKDGKFVFIMKQKLRAFTRALKLIPKNKDDKGKYEITGDMLALDFGLYINGQAEAGFTKKIVTMVDTLFIKVVEEDLVPLSMAIAIMIQILYKNKSNSHFNLFSK